MGVAVQSHWFSVGSVVPWAEAGILDTDAATDVIEDLGADTFAPGALVGEIAPLVGGRGGGRPDMAQAGGSDPGGLDAALERVRSYVTEQIS